MRLPDLDLDLLRCFVTVAEQGGFTAAGASLGLTQSAVSLKVKRLEDILRRPALRRTSRTAALPGGRATPPPPPSPSPPSPSRPSGGGPSSGAPSSAAPAVPWP